MVDGSILLREVTVVALNMAVGVVQIVPKKVLAAIMVIGATLLMAKDVVNAFPVSPAIIAIRKMRLKIFNMILGS